MARKIAAERFRFIRDLAKLKRACMLDPVCNCFAKFFLRRLSKPGQLGNAIGFAGLQ